MPVACTTSKRGASREAKARGPDGPRDSTSAMGLEQYACRIETRMLEAKRAEESRAGPAPSLTPISRYVRIIVPMKWKHENRKHSSRRATVFNCMLGSICLLIGSLLPAPARAQESLASNRTGFSACCSQFDRATAGAKNPSFAQSKAQRRQSNLAAVSSSSWSGLARLRHGFARATHPEAIHSSVRASHPSDRAPPPFAA